MIVALILSFGGEKAPGIFFERFVTRQQRWSETGSITVVKPRWTVLDPNMRRTQALLGLLGDASRKQKRI